MINSTPTFRANSALGWLVVSDWPLGKNWTVVHIFYGDISLLMHSLSAGGHTWRNRSWILHKSTRLTPRANTDLNILFYEKRFRMSHRTTSVEGVIIGWQLLIFCPSDKQTKGHYRSWMWPTDWLLRDRTTPLPNTDWVAATTILHGAAYSWLAGWEQVVVFHSKSHSVLLKLFRVIKLL